jgi:hypothetical protein
MRTVVQGADGLAEETRIEGLPPSVHEALGGLAGAAKEGLLASSVGARERGQSARLASRRIALMHRAFET